MNNVHPHFARVLAQFAPPSQEAATTSPRPSVIDVLIADVRYRARRHNLIIGSRANAQLLASDSARALGVHFTPQELEQVVLRLTSTGL